jgi:hypothetical protein
VATNQFAGTEVMKVADLKPHAGGRGCERKRRGACQARRFSPKVMIDAYGDRKFKGAVGTNRQHRQNHRGRHSGRSNQLRG